MSQVTLRRTISHIGPLQIAIIILAVVTGLVHLNLGIMTSFLASHPPAHVAGRPAGHPPGPSILMLLPVPLPVLFYLNFLGYIVLAAALYLPALRRYQRGIRWTLIVYVAITILGWVLINSAHPNPLAYVDKPIEVALIILLLIEDRRAVSRG
jgi:amino acid transporter